MTDVGRPENDFSGSSVAFDNLFKTFSPMVYHYAYKALRGDSDRAGDIVQQVFGAVWDQFDRDFARADEDGARRLIYTIATRRVVDMHRRADRVIPVGECVDGDSLFRSSLDNDDPLDRILRDRELEDLLQVLMMNLSETEYQIALMIWSLGLLDAEVAEIFGIELVTVRSHKSRARKKIEKMLSRGSRRIGFPDIAFPSPHGGELQA
ncbi:RNA polymerase sigma factor [Nocardia otitidiscaviarum]|uniref:RNA polymerase sigma factor n=1 Tax=Nocardia otitidiscaviarum TaxID=1823 RepID=UPI002456E530|nr:sigma-70 family RNA polymerase sigma factor [Nocardia otitidiscaviarum]